MGTSTEQFATAAARTLADPAWRAPGAWALGVATLGRDGRLLDARFPAPHLDEAPELAAALLGPAGADATTELDHDAASRAEALLHDTGDVHARAALDLLRLLRTIAAQPAAGGMRALVAVAASELTGAPRDAADAYLRLHLLSHRLVQPHGANLTGVFGLLANVVWTSVGPFDPIDFERQRLELLAAGRQVLVHGVDKFPRMTDYVVPSGVRIADADRVRLGAHLAPGTTVMHEGFVNFNAGTLGASMIEGRVSAGVVLGDGSDVGGGASIMGTLSGGNETVISVGERCLIGANAGLAIPLGDDCTVEAGLYLTGGAKVTLPDGLVVKASQLAGASGLLFRRNSQTGAIEALARTGAGWQGLNADLHAND